MTRAYLALSGLAYKGLAESVTTADKDPLDAETSQLTDDGTDESPSARAKSLLTMAFKDVGAAHTLDKADDLVAKTFAQVKEAMDAIGLDWSAIELDIPPPQAPPRATGGWGQGLSMTAVPAENAELAQAIAKNASAVRRGAGVLGALDPRFVHKLVRESVRSKEATGILFPAPRSPPSHTHVLSSLP
jgi:hypothetical protein